MISAHEAQILQALRPGPLEGVQFDERFGGNARRHLHKLLGKNFVAYNDYAETYSLTPTGRAVCPTRRGGLLDQEPQPQPKTTAREQRETISVQVLAKIAENFKLGESFTFQALRRCSSSRKTANFRRAYQPHGRREGANSSSCPGPRLLPNH